MNYLRNLNSTQKKVYAVFCVLWIIIIAGAFFLRSLLNSIPPAHSIENYQPHMTTRILDYQSNPITELFTERRVWTPLNKIPVDIQNAFIAVEDDKFFKHWGISPPGMARAFIRNFLAGRVVQGGSTITQQLAKLIFLTQERTLARKLKELLLALQIEHRFSKEEILQMYLNQVYFGHGAYGVSAAARVFFGKTAEELNLHECALLAGLPRLPSYYSPFNHPERAIFRRSVVLNQMRDLKYITEEEALAAKETELTAQKIPIAPAIAPYFIEHIRRRLDEKYGSEQLYHGGLSIYTTLDVKMQTAAETIMEEALANFDKKYGEKAEIIRAKLHQEALIKAGKVSKRYKVKPSTNIPKVQGALVAIDPKSGAIRAMIGGRSFEESEYNRAVQSKRQPGSTFKPFVWLAALEQGFTASSVEQDAPIAFYHNKTDWQLIESATDAYSISEATTSLGAELGLTEEDVWIPKNYDGRYFGPITLRQGLTQSRNIIAVRLIDKVGPRKVVDWAHKLGIKSKLRAVLSLGLGTSGVNLLEMTSAFGTIAAEGISSEPYTIEKITDFEGGIIEERKPNEAEVIPPDLAYLLTNLLKAVVYEGTGRAARAVRRPLAGKTGTSQDHRDIWFMGFTPDLVCGAWMGYDDDSPLGKNISSGGILVPWWAKFMKEALKDVRPRDFAVPDGITFVKIDAATGYRALPACPRIILQAFKIKQEPEEFCPVDHYEYDVPEFQAED